MTWDEFMRRVRILGLDRPRPVRRVPPAPPVPARRGLLLPNHPDQLLQKKFSGRKFVWIHRVGVVIDDGIQRTTYDDLAGSREIHCAGVLMGDRILFDTSTPYLIHLHNVLCFFADMVRHSAGHLTGSQCDRMVDRISRIQVTTQAERRSSTVGNELQNGFLFRESQHAGLTVTTTYRALHREHLFRREGISETGRAIANTTIEHGRARVVPEVDVILCQSCGVTFGIHMPKRNCAQCGNVFCFACTSYQQIVAYPAGEKNETPGVKLVNVCKKCANRRFAF